MRRDVPVEEEDAWLYRAPQRQNALAVMRGFLLFTAARASAADTFEAVETLFHTVDASELCDDDLEDVLRVARRDFLGGGTEELQLALRTFHLVLSRIEPWRLRRLAAFQETCDVVRARTDGGNAREREAAFQLLRELERS